jgi:hypothetical protein
MVPAFEAVPAARAKFLDLSFTTIAWWLLFGSYFAFPDVFKLD